MWGSMTLIIGGTVTLYRGSVRLIIGSQCAFLSILFVSNTMRGLLYARFMINFWTLFSKYVEELTFTL